MTDTENMEWWMCRICSNREPDEEDAILHVNNEHSFAEQLNVLVESDGEAWSTPVVDELFESEYSARTTIYEGCNTDGTLRSTYNRVL